MGYTTEHDTLDLLRDYLNGALEPEAWEELRDFAEGILEQYADRNGTPCPTCGASCRGDQTIRDHGRCWDCQRAWQFGELNDEDGPHILPEDFAV
jgi:hypothetical protein